MTNISESFQSTVQADYKKNYVFLVISRITIRKWYRHLSGVYRAGNEVAIFWIVNNISKPVSFTNRVPANDDDFPNSLDLFLSQ